MTQPGSRPNSHQPDLCVGIDFGSTHTGVSWNTPKEESKKINIINQWPGEARRRDKVPSVLAKDVSGGETRWGFLCEELAEDKKWGFFKLLLDPKLHRNELTDTEPSSWVPRTTDKLHELVTLYLRQVYTHISNEIPKIIKTDPSLSQQLKLKTWDSLTIDFIFSTPMTWLAPASHCFRGIVSKAGFGEQKLHRVMLGPTEAEAAVVFTCQPKTVGKVQKGDVVLSIDAGGGTTGIAFLKATADTTNSLTLETIHPVTGMGVSSMGIDYEFEDLIEDRIKKHPKA
ncbi:hypothetical protein NCS55_00376000 [Fusarium keratoplasticum]|nr:hypothetical protein NCS55_00376000 [Fusarium keratoplasticum]